MGGRNSALFLCIGNHIGIVGIDGSIRYTDLKHRVGRYTGLVKPPPGYAYLKDEQKV